MEKQRIYLRALELEDYKRIHQFRLNDDVAYGYGGIKRFVSTENEKKWVENKIFDKVNVTAAICIKETNLIIGLIFLTEIDNHNRNAQCPIFIGDQDYIGKGYAKEAKILMLKYAFLERGLTRIFDKVLEDNVASVKLHESCGYKKEGILRKSKFKNGEFKNEIIFGMLKDEYCKLYINEI